MRHAATGSGSTDPSRGSSPRQPRTDAARIAVSFAAGLSTILAGAPCAAQRVETAAGAQSGNLLLAYLVIALIACFALVAGVLVWNRRLRHEAQSRHDTEMSLANEHASMRTVIDNMAQGLLMVDDDLNIVTYNQRLLEHFGMDAASAQNMTSFATFMRETLSRQGRSDEDIDRTLAYELEFKHNRAANELKLANGDVLEMRQTPRPGGGFIRTYTDVSERKEEQRWSEAVIDSAPDAIIICNENGDIVQVNKQTTNLLGYSEDELVGHKVEVLIPPDVHQRHIGLRNGFIENPRTRTMGSGVSLNARTRAGGSLPVEVSLSPIHTVDGLFTCASIRDVTGRQAQAAALRRQVERERLSSALSVEITSATEDRLDDAVRSALRFLCESMDADAAELYMPEAKERTYASHYAWWRDAARSSPSPELAASQQSWLMGSLRSMTPVAISSLRQLPSQARALSDALKERGVGALLVAPLAQGERLVGAVTVQVLGRERTWTDGDTRLATVVGGIVGPALVRQQQALTLREARDQAEAGARAKSAFLATMSHEIRTPMNGVIGVLDLLQGSPLNADQRQLLETASTSASSLLAIINDILDFSKLEAGKLGLDPIPVTVSDIVDGVAETLAVNAGKKGLRLRSFVDPAMPTHLLIDPARLRQILFNLLGNAIKFTDRGEVAVRADWLDDRGENERRLRIVVADTGIGLDQTQQTKLFKPFSQADESTSRRFGGTGLGLTICSMLVKTMGGVIGVSSKLGKGTSFFVEFAAKADTPAPESARVAFEGVRCLVLDRSRGVRRLLGRYLAHWGAETHTAGSLEEALTELDHMTAAGTRCDVFVAGEDTALEERLAQGLDLIRTSAGEPAPRFVVLRPRTYPGRRASDSASTNKEAIDGVLKIDRNPVRRAAFAQAIASVTGRDSPEADINLTAEDATTGEMPQRTAPSVAQAAKLGELILLAEDNEINRKLLIRQLNQIGYAVEAVENGKLAFDQWRKGGYGLVLTDCQMPEMDGYMLAEAIRTAEGGNGTTRIPIIAATASAQHDDAQRCYAAGMDDYVTKPLNMKTLRATLARWMPRSEDTQQTTDMADTQLTMLQRSGAGDSGPDRRPETGVVTHEPASNAATNGSGSVSNFSSDLDWTAEFSALGEEASATTQTDVLGPALASRLSAPSENAVDSKVLTDMLGDDPETIAGLLRDFVASSDVIVTEVEAGVSAQSADAVRAACHKLKSSARAVGANRVADLSVALEEAGKAGDWRGITENAGNLRGALRHVSLFVSSL